MQLRYSAPARSFTEALPIGNGRLGAMVRGGVRLDRVQINDDTCWTGAPGAAAARAADRRGELNDVRRALLDGDRDRAEVATRRIQFGASEAYQPLVDLVIESETADSIEPTLDEYERGLDLNSAVATHRWSTRERTVVQETFVSHADGVLVLRRSVTSGATMDLRLRLESPHPTVAGRESPDRDARALLVVRLPGSLGFPAVDDETRADAGAGASVTALVIAAFRHDGRDDGDGVLRGVRTVDIVVTTETDAAGAFAPLHGDVRRLEAVASTRVDAALARGWTELLERHVADHSRLFSRLSLELGPRPSVDAGPRREPALALPTDERVARVHAGAEDPGLDALLLAYGRYLLIAGSRPGSRPLNLQGIWNESTRPPWSSNYTTNINVEMNYWPAEPAGLPECHEPLLDWIEELAASGAHTAATLYGMRGWVAHHNSDAWAFTLPVGEGDDDPAWSMWPLAGAWLCRHLWEHYEFSGDVERLRDRSLPIMRGAALFLSDWLIERGDALGTSPSTSPENRFLADGVVRAVDESTTADLAIIRDLFANTLEAAAVTGTVDGELDDRLRRMLDLLPVERVAPDGRLAEWSTDLVDAEPQHRHQSHLYGVLPGASILPWRDSGLAAAALETLDARGPLSTGWSLAWRIGLRARLDDAEGAYAALRQYAAPMGDDASDEPSILEPAGVYPNLFCAHPPFQIDGNFGVTAAILEMLVQSHGGRVRLLPALPGAWAEGRLRGARARGGLEVDLEWAANALVSTRLRGRPGARVTVEHAGTPVDLELPDSGELCWAGPLVLPAGGTGG